MGLFSGKNNEQPKETAADKTADVKIIRAKVVDKAILPTRGYNPQYVTLFIDEENRPLEQYDPHNKCAVAVYATVEVGSWYDLEIVNEDAKRRTIIAINGVKLHVNDPQRW